MLISVLAFPSIAFAEQVTIEIPNAGWGITFDAPPLSNNEESRRGSDYAFGATSERFTLSFYVEEPGGSGNTHTDVYDFYWSKASQNSLIDILSIQRSETPRYVRVQYSTTIKFQGQTIRQKHVNYYFAFQGKWVDVHISVGTPTAKDDQIFSAFDQGLSYANTQVVGDQKSRARTYSVPNHGQLELTVPSEWREKLAQPSSDVPPTIMFQPRNGDEFKFLITAMWKEKPRIDFDDPAQFRAMVEKFGSTQLSTAVESKLDVQELRGEEAIGYYYLLTDKAPKPGEYEYAVSGIVSVGELLLSVTVLLHGKESPARQMALEVLKTARHLK
jgi:hypothetical protein